MDWSVSVSLIVTILWFSIQPRYNHLSHTINVEVENDNLSKPQFPVAILSQWQNTITPHVLHLSIIRLVLVGLSVAMELQKWQWTFRPFRFGSSDQNCLSRHHCSFFHWYEIAGDSIIIMLYATTSPERQRNAARWLHMILMERY
jgi:hypothetical protein